MPLGTTAVPSVGVELTYPENEIVTALTAGMLLTKAAATKAINLRIFVEATPTLSYRPLDGFLPVGTGPHWVRAFHAGVRRQVDVDRGK